MGTVPPDMLQAGYVEELVSKLSNQGGHSALEEAAQQLALLSECETNKCVIAKSPGALDSLVSLLFVDVGENVQEFSARALGNLATSTENCHLIAATRILDGLVPLLAENISEALQIRSAWALTNLAKQPGFQISIGKAPAAVQKLVRLLQTNINNKVQLHAMLALVILSKEPHNQLIIVAIPDTLRYLAELLRRNERPATQELAAIILSNLAMSIQNKDRIANCPDVMEGLMYLLYGSCSAQKYGVRALLGLMAQNVNGQAMLLVARSPGVLGGLLIMYEHPVEALQVLAARTLAILMREKQNILHLLSFPGFGPGFKLQGLLRLLDGPPEDEEAAAYALATLAEEPEAHFLIVKDLSAVQGLVQLIVRSNNPRLELRAAEAMNNLTVHMLPEDVNFIATHPGVLQAIDGLFANHLQPNAQQQAGETLANVAASCTVEILNQMLPRILPTLVELLHKDEAPNAPLHVLRTLKYLARSPPNKIQISKHPGVFEGIWRLTCSQASQALPRAVEDEAPKTFAAIFT